MTADDRTVLGVDPGGTETGLIARRGDELRWHEILTRDPTTGYAGWADQILRRALDVRRHLFGQDMADSAGSGGNVRPALLAVEGVVEPHLQHQRLIDPRPLLRVAYVVGHFDGYGRCHPGQLVIVRPGRHGQAPLDTYPQALVGPRERKGTGRNPLRHCRSAWDVADPDRIRRALAYARADAAVSVGG